MVLSSPPLTPVGGIIKKSDKTLKFLKKHCLAVMANSYIIDSPSPSNLTYLWGYGSLLGLVLVMQIITGVTLAMHYTPNIEMAFNSVEHIMRDVNNG